MLYRHRKGDEVLRTARDNLPKFGTTPWECPYTIQVVNDNGTVAIQKGKRIDTINIRLNKPFHECTKAMGANAIYHTE